MSTSVTRAVGSLSLLLLGACATNPIGTSGGSGAGGSTGAGSTTGGMPIVCQATPAATLYSGECTPSESTTFCLFTQNTGF